MSADAACRFCYFSAHVGLTCLEVYLEYVSLPRSSRHDYFCRPVGDG